MQTPSIADLQARGIPFVIRENRINTKEDSFSDEQSARVSLAMKMKAEREERNKKWLALYAAGMSPTEIAQRFGVNPATVRRITGGDQKYSPRTNRKLTIKGVVYASQVDAMKKLRISRETLLGWLQIGRARYVR